MLRRRLALPERLNAARATVSAEPDVLFKHYIENLVFLLQRVVEHVSLATPAVIHAQFVQEHSPYIRANLHLERLSPTAAATVTQYFLAVQAKLKQTAVQELIADQTRHDLLLSHQE